VFSGPNNGFVFCLLSTDAAFWIALVGGTWISLTSLHRALSIDASARLLDSIYRKDRDKSLDKERVRRVRISAATVFLVSLYFFYRIFRS
jgi:hypothetical protein